MDLDTTINSLKHFVFIIVPLSITATYVGVQSFYINFNFDVTTYLGFQDLTIIYSKYTILTSIYMGIFYLAAKDFLSEKKELSYWDKTIFSTSVKRRIIPLLITLVIIIFLAVKYEPFRFFVFLSLFSMVVIGLAEFSFSSVFLKSKSQNDETKTKDKFMMIFLSIFVGVFAIPISVGHAAGKFMERESIIIHLENNKVIDAQKNSNLNFIGKTSSYLFVQDSIENRVIVLPVDKVTEIEYCISK